MDKKKRLDTKNKDTKEEIISKAAEVKDSVSEKSEEVKQKASEAKDTVSDKGEELRATAEKMVNDVLSTLREKQEEFGKTITEYSTPTTPYVDLISTPTEFIIIADLPGVEKDNLSVDITNESVTITVTFPEGMEGEGINYIKRERGFGEVVRNLELPYEIKIKEASANFENAMLVIKLTKKVAESKKLEIK